jgi:hypothetical protein
MKLISLILNIFTLAYLIYSLTFFKVFSQRKITHQNFKLFSILIKKLKGSHPILQGGK